MLKTLLATVDGMIYRRRFDSDWTMEFVSGGCFQVTGHPPGDLLFNNRIGYADLMLPEDRLWVREAITCAIEECRSFDLEYRITHADGSVRWVWERGCGVNDDRGRPVALEGLVQDITKRKSSEHALREAERRFHSLFDNAIEGIFRTTVDGQYLDANPALAHIYGFDSPEELIRSLHDIGSQLYVEQQRRDEFMQIMKARGSVTAFESRVYRKNGEEIWISENARAIFAEDGSPIGFEGTVEDVTQRRLYQVRI
jgi:PAS domain S-box-containing protein